MDNLRFYFVTYNVATQQPQEDLATLLGLNEGVQETNIPDFYIIGLQEVKSQPQNILIDAIFDDAWSNSFRDILATRNYIKVKTVRLQGTVLIVFCHQKHILHLRDMESQYTKTGLGGMWGNKGAVSLRLSIYGCSICLVNCHLTPHDYLYQDRIADYNTIVNSQTFQAKDTTNIFYHDYVFWIGDLNFRLSDTENLSAVQIDDLVKKGDLNRLLQKDQLCEAMEKGDAFSELIEQRPTFPPTYKMIFKSLEYDLKRRPSWTDRILYKVNTHAYENVTLMAEQLSYKSFPQYCQSDHKPVVSEFIIKVFSNYFERIIEFDSIDKWYLETENSITYNIPVDVEPTFWDWIGLFKDGFASLDDYVCYVYAPRVTVSEKQDGVKVKRISFPDTAIRSVGKYKLLYFSQNSGSVLGMSEPFDVVSKDPKTSLQYMFGDTRSS